MLQRLAITPKSAEPESGRALQAHGEGQGCPIPSKQDQARISRRPRWPLFPLCRAIAAAYPSGPEIASIGRQQPMRSVSDLTLRLRCRAGSADCSFRRKPFASTCCNRLPPVLRCACPFSEQDQQPPRARAMAPRPKTMARERLDRNATTSPAQTKESTCTPSMPQCWPGRLAPVDTSPSSFQAVAATGELHEPGNVSERGTRILSNPKQIKHHKNAEGG